MFQKIRNLFQKSDPAEDSNALTMAKVDQQQKKAMKRLMLDLKELERSPVENVSATPLDNNMLEWHCNFLCNEVLYHLILFFPSNYPYKSPSAEFVPPGFNYRGGATKPGKKGTQVCLSIFSDFADWHKEWANEKNAGWSPGYTVQTVLLNMLSFLAEIQGECSYNASLTKNFKCSDCGHTNKKPYPPLEDETKGGKKDAGGSDQQDIVCYISKDKLSKSAKPKSNEELYGYGVEVSGPPHRPSLTTPCEFLSAEAFFSMMKSVGVVHSIMKQPLKFFLPLYLHPNHGAAIKDQIENTLREVAVILPKCNPKKTPIEDMIIKVIPNLMSATVVEFSKGTQHTSDNHLCGYFALHRLFLWALETYPELQAKVDELLRVFIEEDSARSKKQCPHIAERLILLSASAKYRWKDAADAYLSESWRRNVMWYVKEDATLGHLDADKSYRLKHTLQRTEDSRKILAFQVLFLDIAMPQGMSHNDLKRRYDNNLGFPTDVMVKEMKEACGRINAMKSYTDWYNVLKLKPLGEDEIFKRLLRAVHFAIETDGYHWSFYKNAGGWPAVLKKYAQDKTSGKIKEILGKDVLEEPKGKGKGKGKTSPVADKKEDKPKDDDPKGRVKGLGVKGKEEDMEVDEKPKATAARGRGRGRGKSSASAKNVADSPPVGKRGRKRAASPVEEEVKAKSPRKRR